MSGDSYTFASVRPDLHSYATSSTSPHSYTRLPELIKEGERQGTECAKERSELASVQEQLLNDMKTFLEMFKQSGEELAQKGGVNDPAAVDIRELVEKAQQKYEEYEAATAESRAYKANNAGAKK